MKLPTLLLLLLSFATMAVAAPTDVQTERDPVQITRTVAWDCAATLTFAGGDTLTLAGVQIGSGSNAPVCTVAWDSVTPEGNPVHIEIRVPQKWGESDEDWAARCAARVAAMQKHFPSVTGGALLHPFYGDTLQRGI